MRERLLLRLAVRVIAVWVMLLGVTFAEASTASADKPTTAETNLWGAYCFETGDEPLELGFSSSSDWGTSLFVAFGGDEWFSGEWFDPELFLEPASPVSQTLELWPEGEALVSLTFELGEPRPLEPEGFSASNRRVVTEGFFAPISVHGTIQVAGGATIPVAGCEGYWESSTTWATAPRARIERYEHENVSCSGDASGYWVIFGISRYLEEPLMAWLSVHDLSGEYPETVYWGYGPATRSGDHVGATIPVFNGEGEPGEGEPVGDAVLDAQLIQGRLQTTRLVRQHETQTQLFRPYEFVGSLALPDGIVLDLTQATCDGGAAQYIDRYFEPAEPPASAGPAPDNDDWPDAEPLRLNIPVNAHTTASQFEAEAPCLLEWAPGASFPIEVAHTLWYRFEGTGSALTITTQGSDFQTVLGVYTPRDVDQEFVQVACAASLFDEQTSSQATVTIDSEPGVTYYIQAGGFSGCFPPQTGRLRIEITASGSGV